VSARSQVVVSAFAPRRKVRRRRSRSGPRGRHGARRGGL